MQVLQSIQLNRGRNDVWKWKVDPCGRFTVKSAYLTLTSNSVVENDAFFKSFWDISALPKILFFSWRLILDRIPTKSNLEIRGIGEIANAGGCVFCGASAENSGHLFFECGFAYRVWMYVYEWWGIYTVLPKESRYHFELHSSLYRRDMNKLFWKGLWCVVTWMIWRARNKVIFQNEQPIISETMELIKLKAWAD